MWAYFWFVAFFCAVAWHDSGVRILTRGYVLVALAKARRAWRASAAAAPPATDRPARRPQLDKLSDDSGGGGGDTVGGAQISSE